METLGEKQKNPIGVSKVLGLVKLESYKEKTYTTQYEEKSKKWHLVLEIIASKARNHGQIGSELFQEAVCRPLQKVTLVKLRDKMIKKQNEEGTVKPPATEKSNTTTTDKGNTTTSDKGKTTETKKGNTGSKKANKSEAEKFFLGSQDDEDDDDNEDEVDIFNRPSVWNTFGDADFQF